MFQTIKDILFGTPAFSWAIVAAATGAADAGLDSLWLTITSAVSAALAAVYVKRTSGS